MPQTVSQAQGHVSWAWGRGAALATAAGLALASCSERDPAEADQVRIKGVQTDPAAIQASIAALPKPEYEIEGRTVTVRLPYRTRDGHLWVDADGGAAGPLTFTGLDVEPRGGQDGTDLAVYSYRADAPVEETLTFALVKIGKTPPPELVRRGEVASRYVAVVKVN